MSWVKKLQPVILHQQSDIPYVINDEGVLLCYNNFYSNKPIDVFEEYNISFKINPKETKSYSSNYLILKTFPQLVPFENILNIKKNSSTLKNEDIKKICIIRSSRRVLDYDLENYDYSFIISKDNQNYGILPNNTLNIHSDSWARICISVLDSVTEHNKSDSWIKQVPFLDIDFCHFKKQTSLEKVNNFFRLVQVETDIQWIR